MCIWENCYSACARDWLTVKKPKMIDPGDTASLCRVTSAIEWQAQWRSSPILDWHSMQSNTSLRWSTQRESHQRSNLFYLKLCTAFCICAATQTCYFPIFRQPLTLPEIYLFSLPTLQNVKYTELNSIRKQNNLQPSSLSCQYKHTIRESCT